MVGAPALSDARGRARPEARRHLPDADDGAGRLRHRDRRRGLRLRGHRGRAIVWTTALGPGWRPNEAGDADCGGFPFTAIVTFEDAPGGKTRYHVIAKHRTEADAETHAKMGFHDGWGTCADQLGEVAKELAQ